MNAFRISLSSLLITEYLSFGTFKTMQRAKIQLSVEEMALVKDPQWILTKRSVMEKVGVLLGDLAAGYRPLAPDPWKDRFPKISRGENYRGLPYMILDYPAVFDRNDILAVRTLFWWGHYFSLTLHLKGRYQRLYSGRVLEGIRSSAQGGWRVSVSDDEWVHAVHDSAYVPAEEWEPGVSEGKPYLKTAVMVPLENWEQAPSLLEERFQEIMGWLNYPGGETGL